VGSVSYDLTTRIWDTNLEQPLVFVYDKHSEFVAGLDFNLYLEGRVAACSWDETTHMFSLPPAQ